MLNINDFFLIMSVGWYIIGTLDLVTSPKRRDVTTPYTLAVLLTFVLIFIDHLIKPGIRINPFLLLPFRKLYFLVGPVLYFYTRSLVVEGKIKKRVILTHVAPYLIILVVFMLDHLFFHTFKPMKPIPMGPQDQFLFTGVQKFMLFVPSIHISLYMIYIQILLHRHNIKILDFYSYKSFSNRITWLRIITLLAIPYYALLILSTLRVYQGLDPIIGNLKMKQTVLPVTFMFLFTFFSRKQSVPIEAKCKTIDSEKYKKSSLSKDQHRQIFDKLCRSMEKDKLYMEPDLTLEKLSSVIECSRHSISQVINLETSENFYSFINRYRVEEFKTSIKEGRYPNFSLIGVAMECGFRSSSSFYNVFKKFEGVTPSTYLNEIKNI